MDVLVYDSSFEGFLSAVFYTYEYKLKQVKIMRQHPSGILFGSIIDVPTDIEKAERLWNCLAKKGGAAVQHTIYCSYLADTLFEEDNMLAYIQHAFNSKHNIATDYSNFSVMRAQRVERMVHRESHRMEAFIRFKLTTDNIYYAAVDPDFNVLPLIKTHFEKRYANQHWLIYDLRRAYGLYYKLQTVETVTIQFNEGGETSALTFMHATEELYETLWQQYFKSTNIASRKNMKLHLQHVPKRYWKYLSEKQAFDREMK